MKSSKQFGEIRGADAAARGVRPALRFRRRPRAARRGVLLLLVLALLALFAMIGVAFMLVASQAKRSARSLEQTIAAVTDPQTLLSNAILQVIRGPRVESGGATRSVMRAHSLLEDIYGNGWLIGRISAAPTTALSGQLIEFTYQVSPDSTWDPTVSGGSWGADTAAQYRSGCVITFHSGNAAGLSTHVVSVSPTTGVLQIPAENGVTAAALTVGTTFLINSPPFGGTGFGYDADTASTTYGTLNATTTINSTSYPVALLPNLPLTAYYNAANNTRSNPPGGANEDYDAPDYQNMLLAAQVYDSTAGGLRTLPSLHRPALNRYWLNQFGVDPTTITDDAAVAGVWNGLLPEQLSLLRRVLLRPMGKFSSEFDDTTTYPDALKNVDHPYFTGGNPNFNPFWDGVTAGAGQWDVDNDGDGVPDSVWVDLGEAVRTTSDGRLYKPLFAILCTDLDGRLNLNAHGSLAQLDSGFGTLTSPSGASPSAAPTVRGQGYGPAEINLAPLFDHSTTSCAQLLVGNGTTLLGRYGSTGMPGNSDLDPVLANKWFDYAQNSYGANYWTFTDVDNAGAYGTPPDPFGVGGVALDTAGRPIYEGMSYGGAQYLGFGCAINAAPYLPYQLNLSARAARGQSGTDSPYSFAELERLLRPFDVDAGTLPDRLARLTTAAWQATHGYAVNDIVVPATANGHAYLCTVAGQSSNTEPSWPTDGSTVSDGTVGWQDRGAVSAADSALLLARKQACYTTDSWDLPCPNIGTPASMSTAQRALLSERRVLHVTDLLTARGIPPAAWTDLLPPDLLAGLKMDVNRAFGNGRDDNGNDAIDESVPQSSGLSEAGETATFSGQTTPLGYDALGQAQTALEGRQLEARYLYVLLCLTVDLDYLNSQLGSSAATAQQLAQWAVNVVDFKDRDSIMTPFDYDPAFADPTATPSGWSVTAGVSPRVWGCERPELLITETLAFHDRRTQDTDAETSFDSTEGDGQSTGGKTTDTSPAKDASFDQRYRPQGSLFIELYNPTSAVEPFPGDLYNESTSGLLLTKTTATTGGSPVWRMVIAKPAPSIDTPAVEQPNPDMPPTFKRTAGTTQITLHAGSSYITSAGARTVLTADSTPTLAADTVVTLVSDTTVPAGTTILTGDGVCLPASTTFTLPAQATLWLPNGAQYTPPSASAVTISDANGATVILLATTSVTIPSTVYSYRLPAGVALTLSADTELPAVNAEREVYFVPSSTISVPVASRSAEGYLASQFFPSTAKTISMTPGTYAVVGPPGDASNSDFATHPNCTYIGCLTDGSRDYSTTRHIDLDATPQVAGPVTLIGDTDYSTVLPTIQTLPIDYATDYSTSGTSSSGSRRLNITEPTHNYSTAYPDTGFDSATGQYTPPLDVPLDQKRTATEDDVAQYLVTDQTVPAYRVMYLQRLANPLLPYNDDPTSANYNPYRTVDTTAVDMTVFNGFETTSPEPVPTLPAPGITPNPGAGDGNVHFQARQRGENNDTVTGGLNEKRNLWKQEPVRKPAAVFTAFARSDMSTTPEHVFKDGLTHSLGYLNTPFDAPQATPYAGAPASPFPWLTWGNRPFTSPYDLLLVPTTTSAQLLANAGDATLISSPAEPTDYPNTAPYSKGYRILANEMASHATRPYAPTDLIGGTLAGATVPYPHLLNFFQSMGDGAQMLAFGSGSSDSFAEGNTITTTGGKSGRIVQVTNPAAANGTLAVIVAAGGNAFAVGDAVTDSTSNKTATVTALCGSGAPQFQRALEFLGVPSPFVGTETWANTASTTPSTWQSAHDYVVGDSVIPTTPNGFTYVCKTAGQSDATEPSWTTDGSPVTDNAVVWESSTIGSHRPPFNRISTYREPGRININTVYGQSFQTWEVSHAYVLGDVVTPTSPNGYSYRCIVAGASGGTEPTWTTTLGETVADNGATWVVCGPPSMAWDGLMTNFPTMDTPEFWENVVRSRRGYDATQLGDALAMNPAYPSEFNRPFRSATGGAMVPAITVGTNADALKPEREIDATLLRSGAVTWMASKTYAAGTVVMPTIPNGHCYVCTVAGTSGTTEPTWPTSSTVVDNTATWTERGAQPLFQFESAAGVDAENTYRNPYFHYQGLQRLSNLLTTRSNVYAVWITVGYFEVSTRPTRYQSDGTTEWNDAQYNAVYPDGYQLGRELGSDTGTTQRHRAFYIYDRSLPVGFQRGEDMNVRNGILSERFIE